ncbi:retrovirus-related pol polyprotein from transposon TNT 1-94 [Tanacetum coccineum]
MLASEKTVLVSEGSSETITEDIRDQLNAKAEPVQIILIGIDNDIYSTVDACPNTCEMWKAIERLKQGESINVQDLENNLYCEFRKFTSLDGESLESYYSRFYKMMNELVRNTCDVTNHQVNVQFLLQLQPEWQRSQQAATKTRGKEIINSSPPTYDQELTMVAEDDEMSKEKEIDKLMALISLSFKKIYKPTNNNLSTLSNTGRANQDNTPRLNAEQADWRDDTDNEPEDQELEAHCLYMAQIQEVTPDAVDNSGPIFDAEPLQKLQNNDDNYNVFPLKVNIISNLNLLMTHIWRNKALVDKFKGEIEDFKTKNKSLESSNNHFKEANNELSKTNQLMFKDLKKFQAELDRYHDVNYASKVAIDCVKAKGDLMSYKMESEKEMVADLRYFNSLQYEVDSLKSQLETQKTQFLNEIDRLSKEYYYADHMNAILGVYTTLDEFTDLQCDYVDQVDQIKNDKAFKENQSKGFLKEREQYFEIQDLKAQLQDNGIAISKLKKLIEKMKGKSVEAKFEKSLVNRQPNAFKSQRQSVLVIPTTSVNRLQLKRNQLEDKVMPNNSQAKKQEVEDHRRNFKFSNNKTSVTASNDSLNAKTSNVNFFVEIILFIVDSRCSKHMTGNLKLLSNFVEKFLGMVKFGNDQIALILGYGDLVQGNITIKRVYYVEGLNHNLFSVGQFCDVDLEVAFRKSTCFVHDLKGNNLLTGSRGLDLYSITLQDTSTPNPICLMAKATSSQAWLWHRRLSHLNFDTINLLSKYDIVTGLPKLNLSKIIFVLLVNWGKPNEKSFNGKKYMLVIVDDYSRYTWTHFLRSKDKTPKFLIDFLKLVQRGLHAQVRTVRTDKGIELLDKTLHAYFAQEGIEHQTSTARTPEQNGVVKRQNRTLVAAARTMLSAAKVLLFFWAEAIATSCFTQN